MNFLDDWNKKNKQTQKKAGVQSASLPAAQKAELKAPLTLTKSGVVMADGKGGGKLITPTLGPKAAQTPIVKPMTARNVQRSGQLVNTGTMISDTGSNKRQAPLTLTKSGVVMADGKGGGKLITPTLGPKAAQTPIVKPMAARNAQRQLVNTGTMISDTGSNKRQVPAVTTPKGKAQRTVDDLPDIAAFGAGAYGADKKPLQGFLARAGKTVSGGAKGSLAGNMDAMGVAYQAGQGGRTQRNTEELRDAQWAVARAKYAYDTDRSPAAKSELDNALTKMRAFATVLGDGAYEQALDAAYDAAARFGTADLNELYNSLGNVQPAQGTGVQQRAGEAARDLAADVQESANRDIEAAKTGVSKFWQNAIDAGASMTQSGIDAAASAILGLRPTRLNGGYALMGNVVEKRLPGAMIPFATRAFGGAAMEAREGGGDLAEQIAYGAGIGSVEVATELISNVALPFAKAYGGGALDDVVQRGIQKAVSKLGKTEAGKRALNAVLQMTASGAGEGFEELVAQWAEWQMPRIYGGDVESVEDNLADSLQSFIVGGMSGVAGSLVSPDTYRYKGGETSTAEEGQETGWYRGMDGKWRFNEQQGVEGDENAQYSIHATRDLSIKNQMKEYRAGQLTGHDEFYYGETPEILDAAGLARRPLVMSQTDFRKSRSEKHNVPPRAMTRLAEALEDPVLSFEMGDRIGILTKDIDGDGKPLLIAVQNDVELDGERVNRIKSAYGLDNPQAWIANQIAAGKKLRIYDNEKADSFLNGFGYLAERTEDYRLGDTIPEIRGNVNTENGGFVPLELPRLVDANGMDAAQRAAWRQALEQMPREKQMQFEMAADIARRFGAVVQARTMADGVQGSYQDGVISIATTAVDPVRQVLIHELTHHMESSGLYSRFSDAALQFVAEDMGADVDTLRRAVMADYARAGVALDEDGATREIVAKFAEEKLFTDEETVRRLLARDRNLFQRVYDWIRDTVAKLQGTREQRRLIDAQNLYERALRQAADGAQSAAGTQGAAAYSFASQTVPTWEKLGQKPDIEIVDIRNNGRKLPYAAERHDILNSEEVRSLYSQPPVNRDTGELIFVTPATLSHSFSNSGEDSIYAVRHLRKILENAVLTHAEPSRKANDNSTGVYTLFGAVRTETGIQPVKLKVKEYRNVGQDIPEAVRAYFERNGTQEEYSRAYDSRVLSLESIEKEEPSSSAFTSTPNGAVEYPSSSSTIRVHDLLRLVNSRYRKYVPTFSEIEKELSTDRSIEEMTGEDSEGRRLSAQQQEYFRDSQVRDADGQLKVLYHQTDGEFTVFDTRHKGAGTGDDETPFGIFLKSTPQNIGVKGARQMELYADIKNPLRVRDRGDLVSNLKKLSPEYEEVKARSAAIDREYSKKFEKAKEDFVNFITEWRRQNPDAPRSALYDVDGFNKVFDAEDTIVEEWGKAKDAVALQAKEAITAALRKSGYDGVIIAKDAGSWGRETDAYIALDPKQVKRVDNAAPTGDPDIRYSTGRSIEEMAGEDADTWRGVDTGRVTQENGLFRRDTGDAAAEDAISWQGLYGGSDRTAPSERVTEPVTAQDAAERNAYMERLARDENIIGDDPYTVSDAIYDERLRRLERREAPPERTAEQVTQADLDDLTRLYADQADPIGTREDRIRDTESMVTDHTAPVRKSAREKARETWSYIYRKMVDAGHSVSKVSEAVNDPYLYQFYNQARASASAGVSMIADAQTNVNAQRVGASLNDIFTPIRQRGEDYYNSFQMYMYDLHNIDRMSLSQNKDQAMLEARAALRDFDADHPEVRTDTEAQLRRLTEDPDPDIAEMARERLQLLRAVDRADAIRDKPVFSYDVTAEVSRERARRALREHPEFARYQQQVRTYIDNLMQYRVDSGLMTQENAEFLRRFYPNYVPTLRVTDGSAGTGRDRNAVRVGRTVGRARGGTEQLVPLHEALGKQTMKVVREGSKNRFGQRMLDDYIRAGESSAVNRYIQDAQEFDGSDFDPETLNDVSNQPLAKDKTFTVFRDGKLWELTVDDTMFDALKALSPDAVESNTITKVIRASNNLFKSLVTGYNPTFLLRNTVRDLQTAGLYTRDGRAFLRNYPRALEEIRNNGEYWQMYKALGGSYSSVFDYATGTVKEPTGRAAKLMARLESLNMAAEQAPRLAEFMSVVEKGGVNSETLADALYAAADVTVNFGRSGTLGKVLNANYVPFLNPGIQGFDKLIRRVTETRGGREWAKLIGRAALLGIAPTLINALLYHDDEEWDDLRDSDKDTNYMFKLKDGIWLKIPKGRELSLLGITADRVADAVQGKDVDLIATLNTMGNQVAPANPLTTNIASALVDSALLDPDSPGRTWYGGDIESQRLQSYAPGQRYDSSTDVFSKAVGGALGISPKKLNYVLDQYTGVVGDFLLPLLTPQAERGMFAKAFTTDVVTNNRVSGDFFDEADELTYAKNGGDETAAVVSRFWSKQQSACSDLWKEIREVEASDLSDKEKRQKTRELKAVVTGIQKNALAVEETYRAAAEKYLRQGMETDDAYRAANKECFGAEYALQTYNKDVYERAKSAKTNGVSYDEFYTYYFGTKGIKATGEKSAATQKFEFLQNSGMTLSAQAEIYFADMASDKTLEQQAELETDASITPEQFYRYKVASSGMTRKAEKMQAINSLDLTYAQKDALYYAEGWAQSTIGQAPWHNGYSGGYTASSGGNPFLRGTASNPFLRTSGSVTAQTNPFLRASGQRSSAQTNPFLRTGGQQSTTQTNPFLRGRG